MKSISLVLFLLSSLSVTAQTYPTGACPFRDFDNNPQHNPQVAEVVTKMAATTWMACDSSKGCISRRVDPSSPVLIYTTDGPWTCGYSADRRGAGPAWFRSSELRLVKYELNPPPSPHGTGRGLAAKTGSSSHRRMATRSISKAMRRGTASTELSTSAMRKATPPPRAITCILSKEGRSPAPLI